MTTPIITEEVLRRYLLAVGCSADEVADALREDRSLSEKIAEGYIASHAGGFGSDVPEHEYHAGLAAVAIVERLLGEARRNHDDESETWALLRREASWILKAIGIDSAVWEAAQ